MTTTTADATFSFLLRSTVPLVLAPLGQPGGVWLRGVVRADPAHARVVLSADTDPTPAIALEYNLAPGGKALNVAAAVDHARFTIAPQISDLLATHHRQPHDSHGNVVVLAASTGFGNTADPAYPDQRLFSLFSVLVHGGGFPWFEDLYTFAGFMFTDSNVCRIYLHVTGTDLTYGIDLPLTGPDGRPTAGFTPLPQELAPLVRNGALGKRRVLDDTDEYCTAVIDLSVFVGTVFRADGGTAPSARSPL